MTPLAPRGPARIQQLEQCTFVPASTGLSHSTVTRPRCTSDLSRTRRAAGVTSPLHRKLGELADENLGVSFGFAPVDRLFALLGARPDKNQADSIGDESACASGAR